MGIDKNAAKAIIESGKAVLGIEFGSTRIKAVLIDENNAPIASGCYDWRKLCLKIVMCVLIVAPSLRLCMPRLSAFGEKRFFLVKRIFLILLFVIY